MRTVTPGSQPHDHPCMVVRPRRQRTPALRRIRNECVLSFLGPGGFATPDDVEMLGLCQRGFETGDVEWNDISKGFHAEENTLRDENPHYDNELQMRAYWYRWDQIMSSPEQAT